MKAYTSPVGNPPSAVAELRRLVLETMGRRFRVLFVSRGKNEARNMLARLKRLDPETVGRDRRNHQFTVWDLEKKSWRVVPLERTVLLRCGAVEWVTEVGA